MARGNHLGRAETALRRFALKYPDAAEDYPWGHLAVKVKGKIFVTKLHIFYFFTLYAILPLCCTIIVSFHNGGRETYLSNLQSYSRSGEKPL